MFNISDLKVVGIFVVLALVFYIGLKYWGDTLNSPISMNEKDKEMLPLMLWRLLVPDKAPTA